MEPFRAAAVQMVSGTCLEENLDCACKLIAAAAAEGCRLVVLPENFALMGRQADYLNMQENYGDGTIQTFLSTQSKEHGLYLLGGTIPICSQDPQRIRAACLAFSPTGQCVARYDKLHLFDAVVDAGRDERYRESASIEAGDTTEVLDTPLAKVGLSVCYDLRFPELYRLMLEQDVQLIAVAAAFTATTGAAHWESLVRARAIENLCYVVASNQGGKHDNGRNTWGHSMIVDPWGQILDSIAAGTGIVCATIDPGQQATRRQSFPCLEHQRIRSLQ